MDMCIQLTCNNYLKFYVDQIGSKSQARYRELIKGRTQPLNTKQKFNANRAYTK